MCAVSVVYGKKRFFIQFSSVFWGFLGNAQPLEVTFKYSVGLSSNYVHGFKGTEMLEMRLIGGDVVGTVWVVAGPKRCCR